MNANSVKPIIIALGVGALGSGLWELLKQLLPYIWSLLLGVATLGLDSLRDGIYLDAVNRYASALGVLTRLTNLSALTCLVGLSIIGYLHVSLVLKELPRAKVYVWPLCIFTATSLVQLNRESYIDGLVLYYVKMEALAAPYLSEQEMKVLRSDYFKISTRSQYLDHISKVEFILKKMEQIRLLVNSFNLHNWRLTRRCTRRLNRCAI